MAKFRLLDPTIWFSVGVAPPPERLAQLGRYAARGRAGGLCHCRGDGADHSALDAGRRVPHRHHGHRLFGGRRVSKLQSGPPASHRLCAVARELRDRHLLFLQGAGNRRSHFAAQSAEHMGPVLRRPDRVSDAGDHAAHHRRRADGRGADLHRLQFLRPSLGRRAAARLYRLRPLHRHHGLHHRRHHGPAGAGGGDLCVHVRAVRHRAIRRQGRRLLLRLRGGDFRRPSRRPGQGGGDLVRHVRHDFGQPDRRRRDHRLGHHPGDEAARLQAGGRRRHRGRGLDRRQHHATGDGLGRLHHGRVHRHRISRHRHRGDIAGDPLLCLRLFAGALSRAAVWARQSRSAARSPH